MSSRRGARAPRLTASGLAIFISSSVGALVATGVKSPAAGQKRLSDFRSAPRPAPRVLDPGQDGQQARRPHLHLMEPLQRRPQWPAAGQQLARRFSESAAQAAQTFEADLDLGARIDEVVVVQAGA